MSTLHFQDKYNPAKVWLVTRYACGHFTLNQAINGQVFYTRAVRTTRAWLNQLGIKF